MEEDFINKKRQISDLYGWGGGNSTYIHYTLYTVQWVPRTRQNCCAISRASGELLEHIALMSSCCPLVVSLVREESTAGGHFPDRHGTKHCGR